MALGHLREGMAVGRHCGGVIVPLLLERRGGEWEEIRGMWRNISEKSAERRKW